MNSKSETTPDRCAQYGHRYDARGVCVWCDAEVGRKATMFNGPLEVYPMNDREVAQMAAYKALLLALPTLPDGWDPFTVKKALMRALSAYERVIR